MSSETAPLVVVADDEPDLVLVLEIKLSRSGFEVVTAQDGRTAELLIRTRQPVLAVLDITMPHKTGIDVVRDLRTDNHALPIILLSARASDDDINAGLTAGATAYLTKPFSPQKLLEKVSELLIADIPAPTTLDELTDG